VRRGVYLLRDRGFLLKPTIILGANDEARLLADQLGQARASGMRIIGFLDDELKPGSRVYDGLYCLGPLSLLTELAAKHGIQEIVVARSAHGPEKILKIFNQVGVAPGVNLRLSSGLYETITTGLHVREIASVPLVRMNKVRLTGTDQVIKTLLDYTITIPGLIFCLPLFAVIALAVKLDSPGPVFYRRRVMGMNGKQFDAFKFRTMLQNGDEILAGRPELQAELAENHKLLRDPRITRIGDFLRKSSLDELPQMLNILRGEMSWVGPRMICPAEMEKYEHWGTNLLTVKPGLTGKWQVSGRSDITYDQRVRLDMNYIRNWTIWLDLQILWQTVPAVLLRRGAY
jgi:exopolysaccharide biosynthesis polyprenyl glycosylphosphotransferase